MHVPLSKKTLILTTGQTALHQAIRYGNSEIVELLAQHGANQA